MGRRPERYAAEFAVGLIAEGRSSTVGHRRGRQAPRPSTPSSSYLPRKIRRRRLGVHCQGRPRQRRTQQRLASHIAAGVELEEQGARVPGFRCPLIMCELQRLTVHPRSGSQMRSCDQSCGSQKAQPTQVVHPGFRWHVQGQSTSTLCVGVVLWSDQRRVWAKISASGTPARAHSVSPTKSR